MQPTAHSLSVWLTPAAQSLLLDIDAGTLTLRHGEEVKSFDCPEMRGKELCWAVVHANPTLVSEIRAVPL